MTAAIQCGTRKCGAQRCKMGKRAVHLKTSSSLKSSRRLEERNAYGSDCMLVVVVALVSCQGENSVCQFTYS